MVEYAFYRDVWAGEMTEQEFAAAERAAAAQLGRYKRIYRVTAPEENSEALAVCAMAEAIHFYEAAENGGVLAWSVPDERPHATTAHRTFHFVEPELGGLRLEAGEKPQKYTVYAIDTAGSMLVGEVTL